MRDKVPVHDHTGRLSPHPPSAVSGLTSTGRESQGARERGERIGGRSSGAVRLGLEFLLLHLSLSVSGLTDTETEVRERVSWDEGPLEVLARPSSASAFTLGSE